MSVPPGSELRDAATFLDVLRRRAASEPDARAFTFLDEDPQTTITVGELDVAARSVAALIQRHAQPGDRVLLLYPPGREYVVGFLGCLYAGVIAVPAYPPDPARLGRTLPRLQALVADCGARIALTTSMISGMVELLTEGAPDLRELHWVPTDDAEGARGTDWTPPTLTGESLAFLQYTSGSTGTPKGVMLSHRNLLHNSALISEGFAPGPSASAVIWLPPYHDMGLIGGILQPLFSGIPTALLSPLTFLQRPLGWLEAMSAQRAAISGGPNFAFDLCVRKSTAEERARLDLSHWEVAFCGAEPIRPETLDRFADAFAVSGFRREAFYPCYGLAEGTLIVTGGPRQAEPTRASFSTSALERGSVEAEPNGATLIGSGAAIGAQRVQIIDPGTRRPCPPGRVGEIWVSGPSVAEGYWRRGEETRETFRAQVEGEPDRRYLRTGDLGFLRDGELFVTGRHKDLIIIRGRNHYPQDLERTVEALDPALRPGCGVAFSVEHDQEEQLVIVQEVASRVTADDVAPLFAKVRSALAEEHALAVNAIVLIRAGSIPKTSSGKLQRRACRQTFLEGSLETVARWSASDREPTTGSTTEPLAPPASRGRSDVAQWLTSLVASALGVPATSIDPATPLVAFGLDSLRAIELQGRIEEAFGIMLPGALLLRGEGIDALARHVSEASIRPTAQPAAPVNRTGSDEVSVSEGQKALWFLDRLEPGSAAYNVSRAVRIRSELDRAALARAFTALIERHPALRTVFMERQGAPAAKLLPLSAISLQQLDATGWDDAMLDARLTDLANRPFELSRGPLLRAFLFHRATNDAVLLLSLHHAITDFWSLAVMAQELGALYASELRGERASLAAPTLTPDEAIRLQDLSSARVDALSLYWKATLAGAPRGLVLPSAQGLRNGRPSPTGASHRFELPASLRPRLTQLAQEERATPFTVLLASYFALLHHRSGEDDLTVGTPTSGRTRAELRPLVGYHVNPVALRSRIEWGLTFRELLARTRDTVLGALAHAELPLSTVAEQVRAERGTTRSPLFETMFVYQRAPFGDASWAGFAVEAPGARASLGGLTVETLPLTTRASPFDLSLIVSELEHGFAAAFEHRVEAFDRADVERLASDWTRILSRALANPDQPLSALTALEGPERQRLLSAGQGARTGLPFTPLHRRVEALARQQPERLAVVSGSARLTRGELDARAKALAARLRARGVAPEQRIGVALDRSFEGVIAFLAILRSGAIYVPLELKHPDARLQHLVRDANLSLVLTQQRHAERVRALGCPVALLDTEEWPSGAPSTGQGDPGDVHPEQAAYVIYTSGSTGAPKGVVIPHRGLSKVSEALGRGYQVTPESRVLQFASCAFDAAVAEIASTLGNGATLHLMPDGDGFASLDLPGLLRDQQITGVTLPPSVLAMLDPAGLDSLRTVISAGEACSQELVARWTPGRTFINAYGPTEISVCASFGCCTDDGRTPSIGQPVDHAALYVLDSSLEPVGVGVPGELHVGGEGLALGYLGRPALTAERFVPDPFSGDPGARLYRTGDRVLWRSDFSLEFLGRSDDQVKLRGHRIELGEVDAALRSLPIVKDAVAVARRAGTGEFALIGYLVLREGPLPPARELKTLLRERLPEPSIPSFFVAVPELPLTPNGKVDRRALPALEPASRVDDAPRSPLEDKVAQSFARALGRENVGLHDHLFDDLGGSSLTVVRVCAALREALSEEVPVTHLFEHPTVHALAERLSRIPAADAPTTQLQDRAEARRQALSRRTRGTR